jgi:hypothetical protein
VDQVAEAEGLYSAEWWRSRTSSQRLEMLQGDLVVEGAAGAHREIERRARELESTAEREAELVREHNKALRMRILGVFLLAALIALVATMLIGWSGLGAQPS